MKAVILARVSTEMQEDGFSLDAQLDRLRNYCSIKGLEIAKEFTFVESSFHGKRTKFYEAVNYIKRQSKLTALVVDTVDRLQRTFNEFPMLLELVKKEKLALHFFKEGLVIDKNFKSSDLAMWQMQILSANMFVNSTRDNVKRSEERMLNEGLLPGPAPIGYLNTKDENGKKTIIIDPDRGHFIKKLFEEYSTGLFSMDELVKKSKNWGLRNRKSGNPITKAQFADILQNPFYYGVMYYNKSYFPHIYEKLISKELFDKCTEVRTGKFKRTSKHTKEPYIFRGLVRCKHCGCLLSPYTKKGQYVYLRHTDLKNCEHCNNISEKILLKEVEKALASISFDDELKLALADALKKRYEATHGNNYYQLEKNRNQLADVEENQKKQQNGNFMRKVFTNSLPAAITSFLAIVAMVKFSDLFNVGVKEITTACSYLFFTGGFLILYKIIRPLNKYRTSVMFLCILGIILTINIMPNFFAIKEISERSAILVTLFAIAEFSVIRWVTLILDKYEKNRKRRKNRCRSKRKENRKENRK